MKELFSIDFYGPFIFASDYKDVLSDCKYANESGIYIWTVEMPDKTYNVAYIGETKRTFYIRTKEHIIQQLGGNYRIYEPILFKKGKAEVIWDGLWRKDSAHKLPDFLANYLTLAPKIKDFIMMHSIFVAPLKIDANLQKRIEGAIALEVRKNSEASVLFPDDNKYYTSIPSTLDRQLIKVTSTKEIVGLPHEIYI